MRAWLAENYIIIGCLLILLIGVLAIGLAPPVQAAPVDVEICKHVATADSIKIYFCDSIDLFVDQLGFMAFEP